MDAGSPMQKRVAAYLMLMKEPRPTELSPLLSDLFREPSPQFRSFVESHLINIVSSTEPETEEYVTISSYTHAFVFLVTGDLICHFMSHFSCTQIKV